MSLGAGMFDKLESWRLSSRNELLLAVFDVQAEWDPLSPEIWLLIHIGTYTKE